jgi:hypothetical protein
VFGPQPGFSQSLDLLQHRVVEYPPASSALCSTMPDASAASHWASAAQGGGS